MFAWGRNARNRGTSAMYRTPLSPETPTEPARHARMGDMTRRNGQCLL